jgi:hypothetical protein
MRLISNSLVNLFTLLLSVGTIGASYYSQHSWHGGSGVAGPVTDWGPYYSSQSQIHCTPYPGELLLDISSTTHPINANMGGCYYAFPADMDRDGDVDVVSSETLSSTSFEVAWFENDGNGGGWNTHTISINYPLIHCAYPGDLDSDGDIDIIGANVVSGNKSIEWWCNDDGIGDSWTRFRIKQGYGSPLFACAADINGDDTLDVIAPSRTSDLIRWWESATHPPDSSWNEHVISNNSQGGYELFAVDLDLDGDIDILCACDHSNSGLQFWENLDGLGTAWSSTRINASNDDARSVHAADIDGDSDLDVIACGTNNIYLSWFENLDGSCTIWDEHLLDSELENPMGVHAADVTDDGIVDILVADYSVGNHLYLYRNINGVSDEWARFLIKSGWWFADVDAADFNEDGITDILAAASIGTEVSWYELIGQTSGWLESSILDVNTYPHWDSITWIAEQPPDTDIFFQMKSSNDWEDMGAWCDTIFEPGSLAGYIDSTHRYIQYRVGMTADNEFDTPVLDEVRFYWTYLGIEGGEGDIEFTIAAVPNPSMGAVSIIVPPPFAEDVQLLVYDISGKVVADLSEEEGSVFQWDCRDRSGSTVPSGIYIIQGIVGNRSTSVRFVKL